MTSAQESLLDRMVDAFEAVDRAGLDAVLADDVTVRASLPRRDVQCSGRDRAAELMLGWFRDCTGIVRVWHTVERVADIWRVAWRFTLCEAGADLVVEQHAYCTVAAGRVVAIRLICSGFRAAGAGAVLDALGDGCSTLTPRIAAAMRELAPGAVLAVLCDDPAAPDGIAAWSRLTGHELIGAAFGPASARFLIRHR